MVKYFFRRVVAAVVTLFITATITFFLMNAVPGDPFMSEKAPSAEVKAQLMEKYGLDKPLIVQYKNYMVNLVKGDLGVSYVLQKNKAISAIIKESFPTSARIGAWAVLFAVVIGIPLGCISALRRGKWQDNVIRIISTLGIAVPTFVIATTLMIVFCLKLGWIPTVYRTGSFKSIILPVVTLGLYPACYIARLMRSSMLEAMGQDYIRTAKAKGMSEFVITFKHALKNSLIPVITYMGPMIAGVLTGGFVVEKVFSIPGLGRYFIRAISTRDYTVIMGTTIFYAAFIILMNLICDLLYKVVDPRINYND